MEIIGLIILAMLIALYFLPTIIAFTRNMGNRYSILVINFFFGWTLIGWVVCLAMSVGNART